MKCLEILVLSQEDIKYGDDDNDDEEDDLMQWNELINDEDLLGLALECSQSQLSICDNEFADNSDTC